MTKNNCHASTKAEVALLSLTTCWRYLHTNTAFPATNEGIAHYQNDRSVWFKKPFPLSAFEKSVTLKVSSTTLSDVFKCPAALRKDSNNGFGAGIQGKEYNSIHKTLTWGHSRLESGTETQTLEHKFSAKPQHQTKFYLNKLYTVL